jgi:hypothetical protein
VATNSSSIRAIDLGLTDVYRLCAVEYLRNMLFMNTLIYTITFCPMKVILN